MNIQHPGRFALFLATLLALTGLARGAGADGEHRHAAKLAIEGTRAGEPLELVLDQGTYRGRFDVVNTGSADVDVSRVAVRTSAIDPRVPTGVRATFDDDRTEARIAAGGRRTVVVSWNDPARSPMNEVYGHVVVEANTAARRPLAVGIHAERRSGPLFGHVLSILTFLPVLGAAAIFALRSAGKKSDDLVRWLTLGVASVELAIAVWMTLHFNAAAGRLDGNDGYQFIEHGAWIRSLGAEYFVGVDGISVTMVLLTALISFVGVIAGWKIDKQVAGYHAMYLLLMTGMMGVFVALDLVLFYVFWEVMLLPMYFLIGIWGGPRKEYAAIKFFLYTLAGSVFMLLAFIALWWHADPTYLVDGSYFAHSFSIPELTRVDYATKQLTIFGLSLVKVAWVALFVGFAIKIPMFPFHTWLPDAHVEAPTAISVILAGVLLKMGTYGILRINFGILPEATAWAAPTMAAFGTINILYGAFCAMAQRDLKKLVAYSSVSHMGYCLLAMAALTPAGIEACVVQMFNHGTITAMLFTLVGVIYDRAHTRDIDRFGGLAKEMPLYTVFIGFAFMASLGLPGLSGFIGEVLTFLGAFPVFRGLTVLAATGVIVTAAYHLWALQRMFLGKFREEWRTDHALEASGGRFPEIDRREISALVPLAIIVLVLGFWPRPLLALIDHGAVDLAALVEPLGSAHAALHSVSDAARAVAQSF